MNARTIQFAVGFLIVAALLAYAVYCYVQREKFQEMTASQYQAAYSVGQDSPLSNSKCESLAATQYQNMLQNCRARVPTQEQVVANEGMREFVQMPAQVRNSVYGPSQAGELHATVYPTYNVQHVDY